MDWNQLRTILWLRWRLTRNQWSRGSPVNLVITIIAVGAAFAIGLGGAVFGLIAGIVLLAHSPALHLLAAWDVLVGAFLFVWLIGLVSDIQRSETIDIGRMLHLPISLKQVFFINYLASHLTLSVVLFVPGMLGLSLGLTLGRSWLMIGLLPLVVDNDWFFDTELLVLAEYAGLSIRTLPITWLEDPDSRVHIPRTIWDDHTPSA